MYQAFRFSDGISSLEQKLHGCNVSIHDTPSHRIVFRRGRETVYSVFLIFFATWPTQFFAISFINRPTKFAKICTKLQTVMLSVHVNNCPAKLCKNQHNLQLPSTPWALCRTDRLSAIDFRGCIRAKTKPALSETALTSAVETLDLTNSPIAAR